MKIVKENIGNNPGNLGVLMRQGNPKFLADVSKTREEDFNQDASINEENLNFERGLDPKASLGLGGQAAKKEFKKLLNKGNASYKKTLKIFSKPEIRMWKINDKQFKMEAPGISYFFIDAIQVSANRMGITDYLEKDPQWDEDTGTAIFTVTDRGFRKINEELVGKFHGQ